MGGRVAERKPGEGEMIGLKVESTIQIDMKRSENGYRI